MNPALNSGAATPLYLSIHPFTHLLTGFAILNSVDSCSALVERGGGSGRDLRTVTWRPIPFRELNGEIIQIQQRFRASVTNDNWSTETGMLERELVLVGKRWLRCETCWLRTKQPPKRNLWESASMLRGKVSGTGLLKKSILVSLIWRQGVKLTYRTRSVSSNTKPVKWDYSLAGGTNPQSQLLASLTPEDLNVKDCLDYIKSSSWGNYLVKLGQ